MQVCSHSMPLILSVLDVAIFLVSTHPGLQCYCPLQAIRKAQLRKAEAASEQLGARGPAMKLDQKNHQPDMLSHFFGG